MVLLLGFIAFNGLAFLLLPSDQKVLFGLVSVLLLYFSEFKKLSAHFIPIIKNLFTKHLVSDVVWRELSEVVEVLSKEETGALILIENHQPIDQFTDSGILLDSLVHAGVIESIFHTYSPLHDGAMVIKGDRIHKVGVILPLTTNPRLPKWFGTRHRAGLGISEVSDCDVILVSEETGKITHFHKGKYTHIQNLEHLKRLLEK